MSTDYIAVKNIPFSEIKKFNHNGVKVDDIQDGNVLLTDSVNYMWVYPRAVIGTYKEREDNKVWECVSTEPYEGAIFTKYGNNDPENIIEAVENYFKTRLISEYEEEYYKIASRRKFRVISSERNNT